MIYAIIIINGITFLVGFLTGICCYRNRKTFPDTRAGYHMEKATRDQQSWEKANRTAGILCIIGSIVGFLMLPCLFLLLSVPQVVILYSYFFIVLLFFLLVLCVPLLLLKRKNKRLK